MMILVIIMLCIMEHNMKKIGIALLVFLATLIGTLYWLHNNTDWLVKEAIEKYGSKMTGATVAVASVKIRAQDGTGTINGLTIGNPPGFKTPYALKVGRIGMDIDIASLTKDVIVVSKIDIDAPDIIYEKSGNTTNFDVLQKNIEAYVGPSGKSDAGRKLAVGELDIRNASAQANAAFTDGNTVRSRLPDITMHDLGKTGGGITPGKLGQVIIDELKHKLALSMDIDGVVNSMKKGLENAGSVVKRLF